MKKFLTILLAINITLTNSCFATTVNWGNINVSAFVWNLNHPAVITLEPSQLNDSGNIEFLDSVTWYIDVSLIITDDENDNVHYTITPSVWTVTRQNWWPLDTPRTVANGKYIDFTYHAPDSPPVDQDTNLPSITITVNDWSSVSTKVFYVYIL